MSQHTAQHIVITGSRRDLLPADHPLPSKANPAPEANAGEYSFPRSCGWCGDEFTSRDEYWAHRLDHEEMLS